MAVAGHKAQVKASTTSTAMTNETLSVVAGTSNVTWEVATATRDLWDPAATYTVEASEDSGSTWNTLSASEFSISYLLGQVDLDAYTSGSGTVANVTDVRVSSTSGGYLTSYAVLGGRSCSGTLGPAEHMSAVFQDDGEARIYGRQDVSWDVESIERQWTPLDGDGGSEDSLYDKVQNETPFVFEVQPSGTSGEYFRSWVLIMNDAEDFSGGSLHTTTLTLAGALQRPAMSTQTCKVWNYKA